MNRKKRASIVLQAVVDARGRFTSCFVGYPGSVHDARVFDNSSIGIKMDSPGGLFGGETVEVLGHQLPVCLLGDSAYPLKKELMRVCIFHLIFSSFCKIFTSFHLNFMSMFVGLFQPYKENAHGNRNGQLDDFQKKVQHCPVRNQGPSGAYPWPDEITLAKPPDSAKCDC